MGCYNNFVMLGNDPGKGHIFIVKNQAHPFTHNPAGMVLLTYLLLSLIATFGSARMRFGFCVYYKDLTPTGVSAGMGR